MIKILNVPVYDNSLISAVGSLIKICTDATEKKQNRCVSATSVHGIVIAQANKDFYDALQSFFWNLPDGMPGVWIGRLKGAKSIERCYGPDFFKDVMIASGDKPIKHYLCGGKDGVAEDLRSACANKFNNTNIAGTYCPPFRQMTDDEFILLANDIHSSNVDVVWIGLSTPKQELFAAQLAKFTQVHFIVTVGAAFDFHTGRVPQAPKILQKAGLEWFFRLCMEPKRLYKRYGVIIPLFIYFNLREFISYLFNKIYGGE